MFQCTTVCSRKIFCFEEIVFFVCLGGRVKGALGDVADRSGKAREDLSDWLLRSCSATLSATRVPTVLACANPDEVNNKFYSFEIFLIFI